MFNEAHATGATLEGELAEQARWRLRPAHARLDWFDRLLQAEFTPTVASAGRESAELQRIARFAARAVPYYQRVFARAGLRGEDILARTDLPRLPMLTKSTLLAEHAALGARHLPGNERIAGRTSSSGTTGRPAQVLHTVNSLRLQAVLTQRQYRWFRFDPAASFAVLRLPRQLPRRADGQPLGDGETLELPAWPRVGEYFETGPYFASSVTQPLDVQRDWLSARRPDYLMTYAESLEHLAFELRGREVPQLAGLLSISEQLTPDMRTRIERVFGVPVQQNYGLNEVGLVATRCLEGARYHVHSEHCLVEICDGDGIPVAAGTSGHVLVTVLSNPVMPLLRYDTGDLALAVDGPCVCGRTLPAFGEVIGRYSRIAFLPAGTLPRVGVIQAALTAAPLACTAGLRQFQIHQFRDGGFELRLALPSAPHPELLRRLDAAWHAQAEPPRLVIRACAEIPCGAGGKFQDFTSDFFPELAAGAAAGTQDRASQ